MSVLPRVFICLRNIFWLMCALPSNRTWLIAPLTPSVTVKTTRAVPRFSSIGSTRYSTLTSLYPLPLINFDDFLARFLECLLVNRLIEPHFYLFAESLRFDPFGAVDFDLA